MKSHYSFFLLALTASLAHADLIVVEDFGGKSATEYFEVIGITPDKLVAARLPQQTQHIAAVDESFALPIRSERLSPGPVEPRIINAPGLIPFFVIGDDDLSRKWLKERGSILRELGAFGLVVNVGNMTALETLRQLAPGITLTPVFGDDLAVRLQLSHYPVLVTATGIEQ